METCERTPVMSQDPVALREALARRVRRRAIVNGSIALPAVPAMLEEYVVLCLDTFAAIGVTFSPEEIGHLRDALDSQLAQAYAESPRSQIVITYDSPVGSVVNYHVTATWSSVDGAYAEWMDTREPPYFGTSADARVLALSDDLGAPEQCPVLDIGAGTGRNALALARRGHPVDAIEMTPRFAAEIRAAAADEDLPVRVFAVDMFAGIDDLRDDYRLIVLSEVATDFRTTADLEGMFALAADHLASDGLLVVNAFIAADGYVPDEAVRHFGQQAYSTVFTPSEIEAAAAGLPLALTSDVSCCEYEQAHLPAEDWPPTSWYEGWARGLDIFDVPAGEAPVELRWLVYRRT
jgi:SAM-dependent methyltransferase